MKSDLVNTLTGKTVPKQPLKWFWEGFENTSHRLLDKNGTPMLLKLKDWPPDGDIAEYIPKRFHDLVHDFPIQPYTLREGNLNLASYIPDYFLRPELGPKMGPHTVLWVGPDPGLAAGPDLGLVLGPDLGLVLGKAQFNN